MEVFYCGEAAVGHVRRYISHAAGQMLSTQGLNYCGSDHNGNQVGVLLCVIAN